MAEDRYKELRKMLEERRAKIQQEIEGMFPSGKQGRNSESGPDAVEDPDDVIADEIEFALVQMKSETLNKINDAVPRLEQGEYGKCFEWGDPIAVRRLLALPFALRCKDCEAAKEVADQRQMRLNRIFGR